MVFLPLLLFSLRVGVTSETMVAVHPRVLFRDSVGLDSEEGLLLVVTFFALSSSFRVCAHFQPC